MLCWAASKIFDAFLEKTIDEHLQSKDENKTKDFVDVMLGFMGSEESEYRIEWPNIKTIILVIIHRTYMILLVGMAMGRGGAEGWGLRPRSAWFCLAASSPSPT